MNFSPRLRAVLNGRSGTAAVLRCEVDSPAFSQAGRNSRTHARSALRRPDLWLLAGALVCYFLLAFGLAKTKAPWVDEGWLASAPANWAQTGSFGTPGLEPTGTWLGELTGINQYTYWDLPVGITLQAIWFKLLGFSIFKVRLLGILFGALVLISWSAVVTKLSGIRMAGPLTAALLAVDYTFVWSAADGRMDMICLAFGVAGLAAYLLLRESHWTLSLWLANTVIALALFTHPNGLMFVLSLIFLVVYYDQRRISWRDLATATPYFVVAALWGLYILQSPGYFLAQFTANASALGGSRWHGLVHPVGAISGDMLWILMHYGLYSYPEAPVPHYVILIPVIYGLAFLAAWMSRSIRRDSGRFALLCLGSLQLIFLTFFVGLKLPMYLIFILPFFAAFVVVGIYLAFWSGSSLSWGSFILSGILVLCQLGALLSLIRADNYHREYLPTVQFVRQAVGQKNELVVADTYFGYDLGFGHLKDDGRLGFYSGLRPDIVIQDPGYTFLWDQILNIQEPEIALYVRQLLGTNYKLVFSRGPYRVYERRRPEGL